MMTFDFPSQLERLAGLVRRQQNNLLRTAEYFTDALQSGGVVHVYANGHSRVSVEELCVRMGALTGFHPMLATGLTTFTDVVGASGLRLCQAFEKIEGIGDKILDEYDVAPGEPLLVITATGQTQAAVDMALAWCNRFPGNPIIGLASRSQSEAGTPKHSCGKNLHHLVDGSPCGIFLDNGMPCGDLTVTIEGGTGTYKVCPLSSIGALSVIQSLNELTLRELDRRGVCHPVLQNMHLASTEVNYHEWLSDQRRRYARALYHG